MWNTPPAERGVASGSAIGKRTESYSGRTPRSLPSLMSTTRVTHFVAVQGGHHRAKRANGTQGSPRTTAETTSLQQAILNGAEYSIIATRTDGTITAFNSGAERMLGYRAEEVVGKSHRRSFTTETKSSRAGHFTAELGSPVQPGFEVFVAKARPRPARRGRMDLHSERRYAVSRATFGDADCDNTRGQITGFMGIAQGHHRAKTSRRVATGLRRSRPKRPASPRATFWPHEPRVAHAAQRRDRHDGIAAKRRA